MNLPFNVEAFPEFTGFRKIGNGSYGAVYAAVHAKTGLKVAIKMVDKITLLSEATRKGFQREREINAGMDHPFVAQFYRELTDSNGTYLVMELADGGQAVTRGKIGEPQIQRFLCEMLSVVKYLHSEKHMVHRDLKLDNVLLDEAKNIRVIDFGLCGEISEAQPTLTEMCGTLLYMAPEVLKRRPYSYPADLWSVGVNAFALACGCFPFCGDNAKQLLKDIMGRNVEFPVKVTKECESLIRALLEKEPQNRPTIEQLAEHPFIKNGRYGFYLSDEFMVSPKYKVIPTKPADVDVDVVLKVKGLGVDCVTITDDLVAGRDTEATLCYKILKKQKVMAMINSPDEIRSMYSRRRMSERMSPGRSSGTKIYDLSPKPRAPTRPLLQAKLHPPRSTRTVKSQTISPDCLPKLNQGSNI